MAPSSVVTVSDLVSPNALAVVAGGGGGDGDKKKITATVGRSQAPQMREELPRFELASQKNIFWWSPREARDEM